MEKYKLIFRATPLGKCPIYKKGDKMVFDDWKLNLKETDALCGVAVSSCMGPFFLIWSRSGKPTYDYVTKISGETGFLCPIPGEYGQCGRCSFEAERVRLE
jgi:uncharacterized repeat protein (TIGR04076 family)